MFAVLSSKSTNYYFPLSLPLRSSKVIIKSTINNGDICCQDLLDKSQFPLIPQNGFLTVNGLIFIGNFTALGNFKASKKFKSILWLTQINGKYSLTVHHLKTRFSLILIINH